MAPNLTSCAISKGFQPYRDLQNADPHAARRASEAPEPVSDLSFPILSCMLAGGLGGSIGDTSMHSLDTVKTRQQSLLHNPKYQHMIQAYSTIFREEGLFRGLYGGYTAAILGSFPSTAAFFGTYELIKRTMIHDLHVNDTLSYLVAGTFGDLALSVFYVPSEVLKTRMQLQGRFNNPYTRGCGYNYNGFRDAARSIARTEGLATFTFGYKETLFRDVPFSALQLAFYERFRLLAIMCNGDSDDLALAAELLTGAAAGGLAGTLTTPLDVIKTRIQTTTLDTAGTRQDTATSAGRGSFVTRFSVLNALYSIYRAEGVVGMFSGVGPRFIWTGVQSSIMLLLYQMSLKKLDSIMGGGF